MENRHAFHAAGGERFEYVPALNARAEHARFLADLIASAVRDGPMVSASRRRAGPPPDERRAAAVLGTFHEISLAVRDVRASVEFYERLGFTQATTTDTCPHPYGVLTDGRLFIGLHQRRALPGAHLRASRRRRRAAGISDAGHRAHRVPHRARGLQRNRLRGSLRPAVAVLEARTYSPARPPRDRGQPVRGLRRSEPAGRDFAARPELLGAARVRRHRRGGGALSAPGAHQRPPGHRASTARGCTCSRCWCSANRTWRAASAQLRAQGFELSAAVPDAGPAAFLEAPDGTDAAAARRRAEPPRHRVR